ncbi:MAG: hypothetical protein ABUL60_03115 [Myxococcales bacterium]
MVRPRVLLLGLLLSSCSSHDHQTNPGLVGTGGAGGAGSSSGGSVSEPGGATPGGGATLPVGKCDELPVEGVWQDITPPGHSTKAAVNGTVGAAIIVDPFDARTVWLGTGSENDEIWRSDDCGATFTQVNTGPGGVGDGMTKGGVGDGAQWSMQADPVDAGVLYAVSGYGAQSLWKTEDGGHSWSDVLAGSEYETVADYRFVNNVSLDPTDHLHVVVSTHGGCKDPYGPSCIAETKDGGSSWKLLKAPEGWVEGGGLVLVKGGLWIWCGSSMMVTTDGGKTWQPDVLEGGGTCEAEYTIRSFVPAANGKYYLGSRNGVLVSPDGETWQRVANTNGFMVMIAQGSKRVFAANQWAPDLKSATLDLDDTWTDLPAPAQIAQGSDGGIPFLAFDDTHGILYASMFSGGVARMVVK